MNFHIISLLFIMSIMVASCKCNPVVNVENIGVITGSYMTSVHGKRFLSFRGIPFAEPPIGKLRFKPPVPKVWPDSSKSIDATKDGEICTQVITTNVTGSEDCLKLNVYTQSVDVDVSLRPVMVWIYGGGFQVGSGSSTDYGPTRILDHDVILVTFNFRLNSLGFLSTGDEASPGNYGHLDQVEALRWIQKNIHAFGGDPSAITIFGESAGGVSVVYHLLSPLSTGLFHRAIAMSGTAICPYAYTSKPLETAIKLGELVGCQFTNSSQLLVDCLQEVPSETLAIEASKFQTRFAPAIDGQFLIDDPLKLLENQQIPNKVPLLIGHTSDEGFQWYKAPSVPERTVDNLSVYLAHFLNIDSNGAAISNITDEVKKHYFDGIDMENETAVRNTITQIITDCAIDSPLAHTLINLIDTGFEPYMYSFDYLNNMSSPRHRELNFYGVGHFEEMYFLFEIPRVFPQYQGHIDPIADGFLKLWVNFATYGSPKQNDPDWCRVTDRTNIPEFHLNRTLSVSSFDAVNFPHRKFWVHDIPALIAEFQE